MATINTFKELEAWKKAVELTKVIYLLSSQGSFNRDFPLRDQIRRAAISVPSNIAEGFGREGNKELIQYLSIAKGSAAEVQTQLHIALEVGYISKDEFDEADNLCTDVLQLISGFTRYLNTTPVHGNKFRSR
jgi:four helix bundle protein